MMEARTVLFVFTLSSYIATSCSCNPSDTPVFAQEPHDLVVNEGDNAKFTCALSTYDPDRISVVWQVGPDFFQTDVEEAYIVSAHVLTSSITLFNVDRIKRYLTCKVKYSSRSLHDMNTCEVRRSATLTVQYFPDQQYLSCRPSGPVALRVGDILQARCEVPRCEPAVDMAWTLRNETNESTLPLSTLYDRGLVRVLANDLPIDVEHHSKSLICLVASEVVFPNRKLECSIGPIIVLHPPNVRVHPSAINLTYSESASLECEANGFPEVSRYQWTCVPEGVVSGCNRTSKRVTVFPQQKKHHEISEVLVSCTAFNSEGSDTAVVRVLIEDDRTTYISDERNPNAILDHAGYTPFSQDVQLTTPTEKMLSRLVYASTLSPSEVEHTTESSVTKTVSQNMSQRTYEAVPLKNDIKQISSSHSGRNFYAWIIVIGIICFATIFATILIVLIKSKHVLQVDRNTAHENQVFDEGPRQEPIYEVPDEISVQIPSEVDFILHETVHSPVSQISHEYYTSLGFSHYMSISDSLCSSSSGMLSEHEPPAVLPGHCIYSDPLQGASNRNKQIVSMVSMRHVNRNTCQIVMLGNLQGTYHGKKLRSS